MIDRVPCTVRLQPIPKPTASFHDFDDYERLVTGAEPADGNTLLCVLLGGDAGLRCGEMMALTWNDGPEEAAVVRPALGLEGARDDHERRSPQAGADDDATRGSEAL